MRYKQSERDRQEFEEMSAREEDNLATEIDAWLEDDEISGEEEGFMRGYLIDEEGDNLQQDNTDEYD